jgi:hypothetical protein
MTIDTHYTLSQLATVLSALDGQRRNPNTKRNALAAIGRSAKPLDLTVEEVLAAADGLLDGRMSATEFRESLRDEAFGPSKYVFEAPAEPEDEAKTDEPAVATIMPNAGPLTRTPQPRANTKQALMIGLLRQPEGATVEQIAEATGWQHHTVRGAIAGALKKKLGLTITTERVRSVGPNKEGARGSYTIYKIAGDNEIAPETFKRRLSEEAGR